MDFARLVELTADLHCFSPGILAAGEDVTLVRVQLSRWVQSGRVIRIKKGWYTLNEPYRRIRLDTTVIASTIKAGSYVSLQSALAFHGMIPEYVAQTTCVTTGRPLSSPSSSIWVPWYRRPRYAWRTTGRSPGSTTPETTVSAS